MSNPPTSPTKGIAASPPAQELLLPEEESIKFRGVRRFTLPPPGSRLGTAVKDEVKTQASSTVWEKETDRQAAWG